jgi:ClpP class serine protease
MWLMKKSLAEAIENARAKALEPPAFIMAAFEREVAMASSGGDPRIFKRAGDVAEIVIQGALTPKPDWYAYWMCGGNTTYPEIIQALALAGADASIKRVVLNISSPGGYVEGMFDALGALEAFKKPKETLAAQADSAAYAFAAMGGKVTARNKASEFGSVGVCITYVRYEGVDIIDIVSSNAPNKRPDPATKEGQAVIREGLDAVEELFLDAIARGRGTDVKTVAKSYGRGAVFLASAALKAGMIDAIAGVELRAEATDESGDEDPSEEDGGQGDGEEEAQRLASPAALASPPATAAQPTTAAPVPPSTATAPAAPKPDATAGIGGAATTRKRMTKEELKAQHPELFSAVFNDGKAEGEKGKAEAVAAAVTTERDRVEGHLIMGEASGEMKVALESVRSGATMTVALQAKYMAAGMNKRDREARTEDDAAAALATSGAAGKDPPAKSLFDQVADAVEAQAKGGVAA